jgi:hypothetical protein
MNGDKPNRTGIRELKTCKRTKRYMEGREAEADELEPGPRCFSRRYGPGLAAAAAGQAGQEPLGRRATGFESWKQLCDTSMGSASETRHQWAERRVGEGAAALQRRGRNLGPGGGGLAIMVMLKQSAILIRAGLQVIQLRGSLP